jgi:3',5'-cyclic AMP phosphodiesterase CpdA
MKIVHISDIHACAEDNKGLVGDLVEITGSAGLKLDIHYWDKGLFTKLIRQLNRLDPDVVCITGDLTTFGDKKSFDELGIELEYLKERKDGAKRPIIVVPGNHDQLELSVAKLGAYRNKISKPEEIGVKFLAKLKGKNTDVIKNIDDLLGRLESGPKGELKDNWNRFVGDFKHLCNGEKFICNKKEDGVSVAFFPFDSTCNDPLWMNLGEVCDKQYDEFGRSIEAYKDADIKISLLHHSLLSVPDTHSISNPIAYGYNSFLDAGKFGLIMQQNGIDIVLHGHEHRNTTYSLDFHPEEAGAVAVSAVRPACLKKRDSSFDVIEVKSRSCVTKVSYHYNTAKGFVPGDLMYIPIDRFAVRDESTLLARLELQEFSDKKDRAEDDFSRECDSQLKDSEHNILTVGVSLTEFTRDRVLDVLKESIENTENREFWVLAVAPEVMKEVAKKYNHDKSNGDDRHISNSSHALETLRKFKDELAESHRNRLIIKVIPHVISFGATVTLCNEPDVYVTLLPVGTWDRDKQVRMRLSSKTNGGLCKFFETHARDLWEKATDYDDYLADLDNVTELS